MKAERLFRAIGLVDDDLIEEAAKALARKRPVWRRYGAMAACLAVLCGSGFAWLVTGGFHGYGAADSSGAGGSGIALAARLAGRWPAQRVALASGLPPEIHQTHPDWRADLPFVQKPFDLAALAALLG